MLKARVPLAMAVRHLRFTPDKAFAAILWMLDRADPRAPDLHTILKACYFADVTHLNAYGRPIFGASYRAMRYGPVPVQIYEMLKAEPYWLAELGVESYPWTLRGYRIARQSNTPPNTDTLSRSDLDALAHGFETAREMDFDERTAATHGTDWQRAALGWMDYRDMVRADNPDREAIIEDLEDVGTRLAL